MRKRKAYARDQIAKPFLIGGRPGCCLRCLSAKFAAVVGCSLCWQWLSARSAIIFPIIFAELPAKGADASGASAVQHAHSDVVCKRFLIAK